MRDDFGIGFGDELVSLFLKLPLQIEVVLDDAVVDHNDAPGTVTVRMGVLLCWTAVRGPSRVADAVLAVERAVSDDLLEPRQLAGTAPQLDRAITHDRHAGRIVAAVFEPPKPVDQNRHDLPRADVTNDSAHVTVSSRESAVRLSPSLQRTTNHELRLLSSLLLRPTDFVHLAPPRDRQRIGRDILGD